MSDLRQIFRHSKDDVWKKLCDEIGAEFIEGGHWKGDRVQAKVKEWAVTLDTYTLTAGGSNTTFTRLRSPYVNKDGFNFSIYHKSFFSVIEKLFGMQDLTTGFPEFDREFIIKGNNKEKIRQLFSNLRIRELLHAQPSILLQVKDDEGWFSESFPEGVDELYLEVLGVVEDLERLKSLYDLFALTLNHLCHIGSAYEDDPHLKAQNT